MLFDTLMSLFEFFLSFLLPQDLQLILYFPWNQPLLRGVLVPFIGEWYLEVKIGVLSVLIARGMSLLLGCLTRSKKNMYSSCVHTYL